MRYRIGTLAIALGVLAVGAVGGALTADASTSAGQATYAASCAGCHDGGFKGFMTGAPEISEPGEWQKFFPDGVEAMSQRVITGERKHEVRGGCETCTDAEIRAAVQHIVDATP